MAFRDVKARPAGAQGSGVRGAENPQLLERGTNRKCEMKGLSGATAGPWPGSLLAGQEKPCGVRGLVLPTASNPRASPPPSFSSLLCRDSGNT